MDYIFLAIVIVLEIIFILLIEKFYKLLLRRRELENEKFKEEN